MANIWEKAISILAANLNSDLSYLITTVILNGLPLQGLKQEWINIILKLCYP